MTSTISPAATDHAEHGEEAAVLTPVTLQALADGFSADPRAVLAQNAVTRAGLEQVAVNHARQVSISTTVSHRLDDWAV
ncbi:MAG TPA: hypothetical protein VMV41_04995, partial [Cellulomonadaceae bacterium]|nr:hypothetical protein [Cellulomonadaceae bacterium]